MRDDDEDDVGDDVDHDVNGAAQVGIRTVWMNSKRKPPDTGAHADYTINTISELINII